MIDELSLRSRWLAELTRYASIAELRVTDPGALASHLRRVEYLYVLTHSTRWAYKLNDDVRYEIERDHVPPGVIATDLRTVLSEIPQLDDQKRAMVLGLIEHLELGGGI